MCDKYMNAIPIFTMLPKAKYQTVYIRVLVPMGKLNLKAYPQMYLARHYFAE